MQQISSRATSPRHRGGHMELVSPSHRYQNCQCVDGDDFDVDVRVGSHDLRKECSRQVFGPARAYNDCN